MEKVYDRVLQERLEAYLAENNLSQSKAAPIIGISQTVLSLYRRSMYEKGDIAVIEDKLREFFAIQEEKSDNAKKAEEYQLQKTSYVPTSISENAYKMLRYCQLNKGIVVIDGDAGIGKTKAAGKFVRDNPSTTIYIKASPSTGTVRALLKMLARALRISENVRTDELSCNIQEKLQQTDIIIIIDEAQNLKFTALEEIRNWVDEDLFTGKPGIGIALIGNVEVYNRMLGRQEAIFAQQFNRSRLHGRYHTTDVLKEDVEKLFPILKAKAMKKEIEFLYRISHSKWGIRGMVNVFNNAVNVEDISLESLQKMANTMGIRLI